MEKGTSALTWDELVEREPRLLDLYRAAGAMDGSAEHFCANDVWYDHFKPRFEAT